MKEATINVLNAIAFPPIERSGRPTADPFFTRENDPVTTAIARAFGRIALGFLVTVIAVVALLVTAVQSLSPNQPDPAQTPAEPSPAVASATATSTQR